MRVDIYNTDKKYNVIYADPPWEYKLTGGKKSSRGMAKQHYDTMSLEDICNLPIKDIKTDNAVCFMWATFPQIKQALKVMEAWGFIYKNCAFVWIKKNKKSGTNFWGMGQYTRANAEICLLGISEKTKTSEIIKSHKVHQIIEAPIELHSKKPDETRERIIELLGDVPTIELFARQEFKAWDCWGNQTDLFERIS